MSGLKAFGRGGVTRLLSLSFAAGLILLILHFGSCSKLTKPGVYTFKGNTMGTNFNITVIGDIKVQRAQIDSVLQFVNFVFSTYDSNSYISAFNAGKTDLWEHRNGIEISAECRKHFNYLFSLSQSIHEHTSGAFDPGSAQLFNLWGFAERKPQNPSKEDISRALEHSGIRKMNLVDGFVQRIDSQATLNFNAIAKGYGVDLLSEYFISLGIRNFMVEIGGEVRAHGQNPDGEKWLIGVNIPSPEADNRSVLDTIQLVNNSVATSGNYRRFYYDSSGRLIGHTIDPATGYPVFNELRSCSIIHPSCAVADAYATAGMVAGRSKLIEWIQTDSLLSAFIVTHSETGNKTERIRP